MNRKKAVILLSGGLDSSICLYWAIEKQIDCFCLVLDYGQRHKKEIKSAFKIAKKAKAKCELIKLRLPWFKKSSLVDKSKKLPNLKLADIYKNKIPSTYVPARNLIFLSVAASKADAIGADFLVTGVNILDYSGYPDCRPNFIRTFQKAVNEGSKSKKLKILTPLIKLSKPQIIKLGIKLKVPMDLTWSCYFGGGKPCGKCDSCKLRAQGFKQAGLK